MVVFQMVIGLENIGQICAHRIAACVLGLLRTPAIEIPIAGSGFGPETGVSVMIH